MFKLKKKFKKKIWPVISNRAFIISAAFVIMACILIGKLFVLQIVKGEDYLENFKLKIHKTQEIKSTRGTIYDRNGNALAYNELAFCVTIEDNGTYDDRSNKDKNNALNGNIKKVLDILDQNGDKEVTYLHIDLDQDGNFAFTQDPGTSRNRFIADVYGALSFNDLKEEQKNSTASDIMEYLCTKRYDIDIDEIGKALAIRIVNIRFAMSQVSYSKYLVTTVSKDVSDATVTMIKEDSEKLNGIDISVDYLRKYNDAECFAPIIGYTGVISSEEYESLSKDSDDYNINDVVGKAGLEQSMESVLRGKKGQKTFYIDSLGTVLETTEVVEPEAGSDLYLTIDKDLQKAAYHILEQELAGILIGKIVDRMEYDPHDANSTYEIVIPIGDVYIALIQNAVIDIRDFPDASDGTVQKEVYNKFVDKQKTSVAASVGELLNPSGTYKDLNNELRSYTSYIASDLLQYYAQIIDSNKVDTSDDIYKAWHNDGTVSMRDYIDRAISSDWIDTSKLEDYLTGDSKYANTDEILNAIAAYLNDNLYKLTDFSKLVYKYMILDETISGRDLCVMLYEQGVVSEEDGMREGITEGSIDPYAYLIEKINRLEITPAMLALEPCTGSIVITDPQSGDVLALVSYPGYDNNRLSNNMDSAYYNKLVKDASKPLYNYATQERIAPGSTYKPVVASAGLEEGYITTDTTFTCTGKFESISPSPKCWAYPSYHGTENVIGAIRDSCNVFFFETGYAMSLDSSGNYSSNKGLEVLSKYASMYGFDDVSGVELVESSPKISDSDSVRSSIGQGTNMYTNTQMARYVTAIANSGTVYYLTLLDKLVDRDGKTIEDYSAQVKNKLQFADSTWNAIHTGMHDMALSCDNLSTATYTYNISSAGKTGTAEQSSIHPDNIMFIGYAPYESPQIAFSIRIANGYTSSYASQVASDLLMYYFKVCDVNDIITGTANRVGSADAAD